MIRTLCLVALLATASAAPLAGHDTWIVPNRFRLQNAGAVTLSVTSGMEFPKLDHAIAGDRVAAAQWRSSNRRGSLPAGNGAAHALELRARIGRGVTQMWLVLHPRPSRLKRDQVAEYVHHLGIPDAEAVVAEWRKTPETEETAYRYMKYAKTFVRAGANDELRTWATPAGMPLELVPQHDPTSLAAGRAFDVVLLHEGKPLQRYPVALVSEGAKDAIRALTDDRGRVTLSLPAAGQYMLRATTLERSGDGASLWDVHFTTMTFEVRPAR